MVSDSSDPSLPPSRLRERSRRSPSERRVRWSLEIMSSTILQAYSTHSGGPLMCTRRSLQPSTAGSFWMSMRAPLSFFNSLMVSPALPISFPIRSCGTFMHIALGFFDPSRPLFSRDLFSTSSIIFFARSMHSWEPLRYTSRSLVLSSGILETSMRAPLSLESWRTVSPPLPISIPTKSTDTVSVTGTFGLATAIVEAEGDAEGGRPAAAPGSGGGSASAGGTKGLYGPRMGGGAMPAARYACGSGCSASSADTSLISDSGLSCSTCPYCCDAAALGALSAGLKGLRGAGPAAASAAASSSSSCAAGDGASSSAPGSVPSFS
mmetsp:Transcript_107354/g.299910  ORF Transcript_107354/g.299910 Transcript_107354/m.299910 type:complete len:322 (+) Transcript_107354:2033-2998(+)